MAAEESNVTEASIQTQESEPKQGKLFDMIKQTMDTNQPTETGETNPQEEVIEEENVKVDTSQENSIPDQQPVVPEPQTALTADQIRAIMKEEVANIQSTDTSSEPVSKPVYELVQETNDYETLESTIRQQYDIREGEEITPGHMMKYMADVMADALDHKLRHINPVMEDIAPMITSAKEIQASQERINDFLARNKDFGDYSEQVQELINEQYPNGVPDGLDTLLTAETYYKALKKSNAVDTARRQATSNTVEARRRENGAVATNHTAPQTKKSRLRSMIETAGA